MQNLFYSQQETSQITVFVAILKTFGTGLKIRFAEVRRVKQPSPMKQLAW